MRAQISLQLTAATVVVALCLLRPPASAREDAPVPPLPRVLQEAAADLLELAPPADRLHVARPEPKSLPDGYMSHMLCAHLRKGGADVRAVSQWPDGFPEGLPARPLCVLRHEGGDLFVKCAGTVEGQERSLQVAAYDAESGARVHFERRELSLPRELSALIEGQPQPLPERDRKWFDLLDRLFEPPPMAEEGAGLLETAEADYFFGAGLWAEAARRYLALAEPGPSPAHSRAVVSLQLAGLQDDARDRLQAALNTHPDNGPLYALGGWLMQRQGKAEDARMLLEQARLVDMAREGVYLYARGLMALETLDAETARTHLTRAAELLPGSESVQMEAARILWSRGETEAAVAHARRAARSPGASAQTWAELAMMLDGTDDHEGAVEALREGFRRHRDNPILARRLAARLKQDGRHEEALSVLRRAVRANPCSPSLLLAYGETAAHMWRMQSAEDRLRRAVLLSPDSAHARLQLAEVLARQRRYVEAVDILREIPHEQTGHVPARIAEARILDELGLSQQATALLEEVAGDPQHEVEARLALAAILGEQSRSQAAVRNAQIAVSARADAVTYAALCRAFLGSGEIDKAEAAALSAVEHNPQTAPARMALARVRLAQNRPADALHEAERAAQLAPFSVEALELKGEAQRRLHMHAECRDTWKRALALNPWDSALHLKLARLLVAHLNDRESARDHYARHGRLEAARAHALAALQRPPAEENTHDGMD